MALGNVDLVVNQLYIVNPDSLSEKIEDGILHSKVHGGLHVCTEAQEGLVDQGTILHNAFIELNIN